MNINAYVFETEFGSYIIDIWKENGDDRVRLDIWESKTISRNKILNKDTLDTHVNISDVPDGYKLYMEHGGNVAAAILCKKVFVALGVKL